MHSFLRTPLLAAAVLASCLASSRAQDNLPQLEAFILQKDGAVIRGFVVAATGTVIQYLDNPHSSTVRNLTRSDLATVYLLEPPDYTEAVETYESRDFAKAREAFAKVKERYRRMRILPGNHSTLAAYHEMECLRHLGDYTALAAALKDFNRTPLLRPYQATQLELYALWDAVGKEDWPRLEILARQWDEKELPGYQRAQVGFCYGLALEKQQRPLEALSHYHTALTADSAASADLAQAATLAILAIHAADPEVAVARQLFGTESEKSKSPGHYRLIEAAAVAALHPLLLPNAPELPEEYRAFTRYLPADGG